LAEPLAWLVLEDLRGLVGPDQSFVQEELISLGCGYAVHCYHPKLIIEPKTSPYPKNLNTFKMGETLLDLALIAG
jgi:hypothetical protein